ncbi:28652_t:CDS:2, partial [Dentiscutata erythropus]
NEKNSAGVNLFWVRYSIDEWKQSIDDSDDSKFDVLRCPFTNLRRAFSLCTTKNEIDALVNFANSLGPDEKKNLLATGKEKYSKRLKNKFQKIKSADLLIPFMTENENIQQIFATIIDYDDFTTLVYEDPTNPLLSGIMDFASPHTLLKKIFSRRLINILSKFEEYNFDNEIRVYLESTINNSEEEKPTNSSISNHDLEVCIKAIKFFKHIWHQKKYEDKCLNINESTYTDDMFTYIMKDFCMEDADLITICGELETTCSRHRRQGLHEVSLLSEMDLSVGNFENALLGIDKSKRGHKIDAAIGIRLMNEHLIQFLIVESKKPGTDPSNDKKKQLQEQYDQINEMFCFYEDKFKKFITKELLKLMHRLFVIGARISDDQLEITVYDIPGSLIGRRRLFRQNVYVPSKMQFKHHTVDYLESLVGIKMLLKKLKSQLRTTEDILNKLVNEGNNNDKLQISMRTQTIVRNNRNSSGAM